MPWAANARHLASGNPIKEMRSILILALAEVSSYHESYVTCSCTDLWTSAFRTTDNCRLAVYTESTAICNPRDWISNGKFRCTNKGGSEIRYGLVHRRSLVFISAYQVRQWLCDAVQHAADPSSASVDSSTSGGV
ncbi:hypothetical protein Bbelb_249600 [Branchiostoma belcheri]|nr:hypothetical protein Bbelb_249600 [Branchiostoma belcheri]